MDTEKIVVDRDAARALYRKYREHQHWSQPIDLEIQRTYKLIAQGRLVIRAIKSIVDAGVNDDGYPKLAIARADAQECWYNWSRDGSARMAMSQRLHPNERRTYIDFPPGSFPQPHHERGTWAARRAVAPLVPVHLRPRRGLQNYHVIWEAEWRNVPPLDPMLLRRIGLADLWVVVAAWDLTPVEQAALAARL
jgi:hypothetical protein